MPTSIHNDNNPDDFKNHVFLLFYIMLNSVSVGGAIRTTKDIINGQTDSNYIVVLLMWIGCTVYTAERAIKLYKNIYNKQDNQK